MNAMHVLRRTMGLVAVSAALAACGDDEDPAGPAPDGPTVRATTGSTFSPATLTVDVGDAVTWIFESLDHNVTFGQATGAPANIGDSRNTNVPRTFGTAGTFQYMCTLHPGMNGNVVVQ